MKPQFESVHNSDASLMDTNVPEIFSEWVGESVIAQYGSKINTPRMDTISGDFLCVDKWPSDEWIVNIMNHFCHTGQLCQLTLLQRIEIDRKFSLSL